MNGWTDGRMGLAHYLNFDTHLADVVQHAEKRRQSRQKLFIYLCISPLRSANDRGGCSGSPALSRPCGRLPAFPQQNVMSFVADELTASGCGGLLHQPNLFKLICNWPGNSSSSFTRLPSGSVFSFPCIVN